MVDLIGEPAAVHTPWVFSQELRGFPFPLASIEVGSTLEPCLELTLLGTMRDAVPAVGFSQVRAPGPRARLTRGARHRRDPPRRPVTADVPWLVHRSSSSASSSIAVTPCALTTYI